jgi:hypothetical protein
MQRESNGLGGRLTIDHDAERWGGCGAVGAIADNAGHIAIAVYCRQDCRLTRKHQRGVTANTGQMMRGCVSEDSNSAVEPREVENVGNAVRE